MDVVMLRLVLQLAVIFIFARLGGFIFSRLLKLPSVLGELSAGLLIGPYALGGMHVPGAGTLFPLTSDSLAVSPELYGFATLASILLLFLSGLESDLTLFVRYSVVGIAVGVGGVVLSFLGGAYAAIFFGLAPSFSSPTALFLGVVSTATSVGITARILADKRKMDSPEGVTILAAAVLDDVLGIVLLAVVVAISRIQTSGGRVNWADVGRISAKAIGFWLIFTVIGLVSARRITKLLKPLRSMEVIASIAFGLALLMAGLMEMAGLALIIGAYVTGLALSRTDLAHAIQNQLHGMYNMLVPVFFCVMGMMVNFAELKPVFVFGLVFSVIAVAAKLIGCGLPAHLMNFNRIGALRIGLGMVPRGEVALIVAGIGLSTGSIEHDVFGAAVMMTLLTTLLAPPLLAHSFTNKPGVKHRPEAAMEEIKHIALDFPSTDIASFMFSRLAQAFRNEEFFVYRLGPDVQTYQIRKDDMVFTLAQEGDAIQLSAPAKYEHVARFIFLEELLTLQDLATSFERMHNLDGMKSDLIKGVFDGED